MRSSPVCPSSSSWWLLACLPLAAQGRPDAGSGEPQQGPPQPPTQQAPAERPRPADVDGLFAAFAQLRGLSASFREEKHLSLLAIPLESRGKLHFLWPGYLTRQVESPEPSRLRITPTALQITGKQGEQTIDLRQSERVRLFVTSLVHVFRGDLAALRRHYEVTYQPTDDPARPRAWNLTLAPKDGPLVQLLSSLTLSGEGEAVLRIELAEPNGDRTITSITAVDPQRTFTAEERRELFGIEAAVPADAAPAERTK